MTADNSGNFSKDVDLSANTTHNITAKATDTAGNTSDASAVLAITVDTVAPTMTTNTTGQIASSSDLVATFSEAIAKGTGDIVIKESGDGTVFETLSILGNNVTIGGADNRTLTINPSADLESNKSYYIEIA
ncbi:Ig-like domain-containing protein, partial [Bathymodiolus thermophilus thioautotrophic gill symbiont]|uniref:Ig-like domain-containing protein n=1 Tax=Bathymodiolus thermophilus thioautotrophic gill symbiont TaxID=2360 RepID=UPI001160BE2D